MLQLDLGKLGIEELGELSRRGYAIAAEVLPQAELYRRKQNAAFEMA